MGSEQRRPNGGIAEEEAVAPDPIKVSERLRVPRLMMALALGAFSEKRRSLVQTVGVAKRATRALGVVHRGRWNATIG